MSDRWPNLKALVHPQLDWQGVIYSEARLLQIADAVAKNPHPIQTRTERGDPGVWDTAIEQVLRALAGNKAALNALNHKVEQIPAEIVGRNRAVHCRVRSMLVTHKAEEIHAEVAKIWGVSAGQIRKDLGAHKDADRIAKQLIHAVCAVRKRERIDVLKDLDADMCHRAKALASAIPSRRGRKKHTK